MKIRKLNLKKSKNLFLHENNEWVNNENQKTQPQKL